MYTNLLADEIQCNLIEFYHIVPQKEAERTLRFYFKKFLLREVFHMFISVILNHLTEITFFSVENVKLLPKLKARTAFLFRVSNFATITTLIYLNCYIQCHHNFRKSTQAVSTHPMKLCNAYPSFYTYKVTTASEQQPPNDDENNSFKHTLYH